jgi:pilus assembly protein CpaC
MTPQTTRMSKRTLAALASTAFLLVNAPIAATGVTDALTSEPRFAFTGDSTTAHALGRPFTAVGTWWGSSAANADTDAPDRPALETPASDTVQADPFATTPEPKTHKLPAVEWREGPMFLAGVDTDSTITLGVNRTHLIRTSNPVSRISVAQPDVADVNPISQDELLVTAKSPGSTQLIVWNDAEQSQVVEVRVRLDLDALEDEIRRSVPGSNILASVLGDSIVLRGQAPDVRAAELAVTLAGTMGEVVNLIEVAGGQQLQIEVQFAEVARSVTTQLGVNWGISDGVSVFGTNTAATTPLGLIGGALDIPSPLDTSNIFGTGQIGGTTFAFFIDALKANNLLRTLANPNLTVTSGQEARFVAGGELPVPVPSQDGITIEYKDFGIQLTAKPTVLGDGRIRLTLSPEVSEVDFSVSTTIAGGRVPGFRTRRVETTIELAEGQTLALAGLLNDEVVASLQEVPGIGRIPVLGQLFRSTRYQRRETELVILVTPRLVAPMNPAEVGPLPGEGWRHPSDLEQFLLGDVGGDNQVDPQRDWTKEPAERGAASGRSPRAEAAPPPLFMGQHGFTPAAPPASPGFKSESSSNTP